MSSIQIIRESVNKKKRDCLKRGSSSLTKENIDLSSESSSELLQRYINQMEKQPKKTMADGPPPIDRLPSFLNYSNLKDKLENDSKMMPLTKISTADTSSIAKDKTSSSIPITDSFNSSINYVTVLELIPESVISEKYSNTLPSNNETYINPIRSLSERVGDDHQIMCVKSDSMRAKNYASNLALKIIQMIDKDTYNVDSGIDIDTKYIDETINVTLNKIKPKIFGIQESIDMLFSQFKAGDSIEMKPRFLAQKFEIGNPHPYGIGIYKVTPALETDCGFFNPFKNYQVVYKKVLFAKIYIDVCTTGGFDNPFFEKTSSSKSMNISLFQRNFPTSVMRSSMLTMNSLVDQISKNVPKIEDN